MGIVTHHHKRLPNNRGIFKYYWPFTLVLWPWKWKGFICKLSGYIISSFLKMDLVIHRWFGNIESVSIHDLWPWYCDLDIEMSVHVNSRPLLMAAFWKWSLVLHKVVQHIIFKHSLCQFSACINVNLLKMDRVTHYQNGMMANLLKMDILIHCHQRKCNMTLCVL